MSNIMNRVENAVEDWFDTHIRTGAIARATAAYNQAVLAKAHLIAKLKDEIERDADAIEDKVESVVDAIDGQNPPDKAKPTKV